MSKHKIGDIIYTMGHWFRVIGVTETGCQLDLLTIEEAIQHESNLHSEYMKSKGDKHEMSKVLKTFEYKGHKIELKENHILFHGTTSENLKSIYEKGITPEKSVWNAKSVWLDTRISSAYNFANNSEGIGRPEVLVIYTENLDLNKLELDDYNFDFFDEIIEEDGSICFDQVTLKYSGVIPSEGLDVVIEEVVDRIYIQELKEYLEELGEI